MIEEWKIYGNFEVSSFGNIKKVNDTITQKSANGKIYTRKLNQKIKKVKTSHGYLKTCGEYIHILVAKAFIPNPNNLYTVNHKDENKENNKVDNLEWMTIGENTLYSIKLHPERKKKMIEGVKRKLSKKILSKNNFNGEIEEWESIGSVVKEFNISQEMLLKCIKNKKQFQGYGFTFK